MIACYRGTTISGLQRIAENDDASDSGLLSLIDFDAQVGETFNIQVDGYNGRRGDLVLNVLKGVNPTLSPVEQATVSDGFDFPVGSADGGGWRLNHNGLWFLDPYNYGGTCGMTFHPGHDFNQDGTTGDQDRYEPVYAASNGVVVASMYDGTSTWGNIIVIEHTLPDGTKIWTLYGHLEDRNVSVGDVVRRRQQIGRVGTGSALHPVSAHLHFEVRRINMAATAFPCGQSQTYVTDRYFDPDTFILQHRGLSSCKNGTSTLRNRDGGPAIHPPGSALKTATDTANR